MSARIFKMVAASGNIRQTKDHQALRTQIRKLLGDLQALLEVVLRLLLPEYRRPITGTLIFGVILLGLGLTSAIGFQVTWPVFVIAVGVAMLISGLLRWR